MYSLLSLLAIPASINALVLPRQVDIATALTASVDVSGIASVNAVATASIGAEVTNGVSVGVDAGVTASAELLNGVLPTGIPVVVDASASVGLDISSAISLGVDAAASLNVAGIPVDATASVDLGLLGPNPTLGLDVGADVSGVASLDLNLSPTPTVGLHLLNGLLDVGLSATPTIGVSLSSVDGLLASLLGNGPLDLSTVTSLSSHFPGLDLSSLAGPNGTVDINALKTLLLSLGADAEAVVSILLNATGFPALPVPTAGLSVPGIASLVAEVADVTAALELLANPTAILGADVAIPSIVSEISADVNGALALGLSAPDVLDLVLGQTAGLDIAALANSIVGPVEAEIAATASVGALAARETVPAVASVAGVDAGLSCALEDLYCCASVGLQDTRVVADVLDLLGMFVPLPADVTVGVNCTALEFPESLLSLASGANLVCCPGATFEGKTIVSDCTTISI
ncbi:hypothetical protein DACRYDRAFT_22194 [Dacryopinax primogenitus]|uniref:RNI-like protein n=1 Tax=Dacryopinax primogenitus (strain DJM 731) TaxID=1858805 RepID=M5GCJ4_DACPD|nr:uncharacterized protein DACRYDRAFT_22194 [Dacryopinax primogenitus]EJU01808.1 hypothetical protein DACRYDRAFT_22194 [Dacryopinax primogenitus]